MNGDRNFFLSCFFVERRIERIKIPTIQFILQYAQAFAETIRAECIRDIDHFIFST